MFVEICGSFDLENISLWKLSMIYSVVTLNIFLTPEQRIEDIRQNMDIILSLDDPHRDDIHLCIEKIRTSEYPDDLNLYIDAYMAFGPKIKT